MRPYSFLHSLRAFLTAICLIIVFSPSQAWSDDNEDTLGLFNAWTGISSTASRGAKPLSQTAENVTVITAKEIELLNAHTLADILETLPGVQIQQLSAPGSTAYVFIQSSRYNQVTVLLDGAPINELGDHFANISAIPAQIIERVEIVKGSASSAWGQALGGIINVITKSPEQRLLGGSVTASIGKNTTADTRAEVTGTNGRLGYYLSSGYLGSNGISPNSQLPVYSNSSYAKLTYELPSQGQLTGTFSYSSANRGTLFSPDILDFKEDQQSSDLLTTLALSQPLTQNITLDVLVRHVTHKQTNFDTLISSDTSWSNFTRSLISGIDTKVSWRGDNNLLVGGIDYEHIDYLTDLPLNRPSRNLDRGGLYLNDTLTLGSVSISPGARIDRTGNGDLASSSIGAVWQTNENTILRAYTARGYSLFEFNKDRAPEKVWTSQIGVESGAITYLWFKGTIFRNVTRDIIDIRNIDETVPERRVAIGSELEMRTTPVFNTSLGAGYTFTDTTHGSNNSQVYASPRHTVQLTLRYNDGTYRALLAGRHLYWNSVPGYGGKYNGLIWDLHLGATLLKRETSSLELFLSGHNLFNGTQYQDETQPNNNRWFEGGARVRF